MRALSPATSTARDDLSPFDAATSPVTELDPYARLAPFRKSVPCMWCGGTVSADVECPAAGVREHVATERHAAMRRTHGL